MRLMSIVDIRIYHIYCYYHTSTVSSADTTNDDDEAPYTISTKNDVHARHVICRHQGTTGAWAIIVVYTARTYPGRYSFRSIDVVVGVVLVAVVDCAL